MSHKGFRLCPYYTIWAHLCIAAAKKRGIHEGNPRVAGSQQFLYNSQHLCALGYGGKEYFCRKNDQGIQHLSGNPGYHIGGENSGENWPKAKKKPGLSNPRNPVIPSGAGGGTRTPTMSPSADFESATSTNSITPAISDSIIHDMFPICKRKKNFS